MLELVKATREITVFNQLKNTVDKLETATTNWTDIVELIESSRNLEVGLGGRLDATNIVCPVLSIITSISFDHTELLGNTLEAIAVEKGGIIKKEVPQSKVRFVSILELSANTLGSSTTRMSQAEFENYFTADKPVIINFHGYPETLKQSLFDYEKALWIKRIENPRII